MLDKLSNYAIIVNSDREADFLLSKSRHKVGLKNLNRFSIADRNVPLLFEDTMPKHICSRCGKEAHHTHHKDHDHKNNKPKNLEPLCTLCHAREHNTTPRFSELRKLVAYYEKIQKIRLYLANSINGFNHIELYPPQELLDELSNIKKIEALFEKKISAYWEQNPTEVYKWATSIRGIADVMVSKILSEINFDKTPSIASLWAYTGMSPETKQRKGRKSNWNHNLKEYCYQLANSFIKQRTEKYRDIYDYEKEKQIKNGLKKGHAHNRAIRKTAKIFLRNLFIENGGKKDHNESVILTDIPLSLPPKKKKRKRGI
jgi:5-methylcytosine-specific restriction endonuclease McrA